MFCLKTFIWTRKKQLWQPCHKFSTKLSKSFSHQLRKKMQKETYSKELFSIETFARHVIFSFEVFVEFLWKIRNNFVSKTNIGGTWNFCFKNTRFQKIFHLTCRTQFWHSCRKICIKFWMFFQKNSQKQRLIELHCFYAKETCLSWLKFSVHFEYSFGNPVETFVPRFEISSVKIRKEMTGIHFLSKGKTSTMTFHSTNIIQCRQIFGIFWERFE